MAEPKQPPFAGLEGANVEVRDAPPTQQSAASDAGKPWEGLGSNLQFQDEPPKDEVFESISEITKRQLADSPPLDKTVDPDFVDFSSAAAAIESEAVPRERAVPRENRAPVLASLFDKASKAVGDFIAEDFSPETRATLDSFARGATFGVSDLGRALAVHAAVKDNHPGLTFAETAAFVFNEDKKNSSLMAEIAGALAPAAAVQRGASLAVRKGTDALVRSGRVDGALRWVADNPKLAFLGGAIAQGAAGGFGFEAIRESVEQATLAGGDKPLNGTEIAKAAIGGALVGALGAPIAQGAISGGAKLVQGTKAFLGVTDAQAAQAAFLVHKAIRLPGEAVENTLARIQEKIQTITERTGRPAALAEVLHPEQVENLVSVVGRFRGLDIVAREGAENIEEVARRNLDDAARTGRRLKDTGQLEEQADRLFTEVTRKEGQTLVDVTDEALEALTQNRVWLNGSLSLEGGKAIASVIDAKTGVEAVRARMRRLNNAVTVDDARTAVANLRLQIAELVDEAEASAKLAPSEINRLKNMLRVTAAEAGALSATSSATNTVERAVVNRSLLNGLESELAKFEREGLKITLSDANAMRAKSSADARRRSGTPEGDGLRELNRALTTVGVAEVPRYATVRKLFSLANTRAEAQAIGAKAVRDKASPANIKVAVERGRTLDGETLNRERARVQRVGAEEGAALEVSRAARGTLSETKAVAEQITGSPNSRESLRIAAPERAERLITESGQVTDSLKAAVTLKAPRSPADAKAEREAVRDFFETGFLAKLGGAASAGLTTRILFALGFPRGTARKTVEMLVDPAQVEKAFMLMQRKGIDLRVFFGAVSARLADFDTRENRNARR